MKKQQNQVKKNLHVRNKNRERYDLDTLVEAVPELKKYIIESKANEPSIDFKEPNAVKLLNTAILKVYYGITNWDFPNKNLCPPIPGRADYIHHLADLLEEGNLGKKPNGEEVLCIDIGVGASCIYPILGAVEYGWKFIGTDVDQRAIACARKIIESNNKLASLIECRLQEDPKRIFSGIIRTKDKLHVAMCNPPFHASKEAAQKGTKRKIKNLSGKKQLRQKKNFSGNLNELIYPGGEVAFIQQIILESKLFSKNILWFTTLVSKKSNLDSIYKLLKVVKPIEIKTIELGTGNKVSRIVAWTFIPKKSRGVWRSSVA